MKENVKDPRLPPNQRPTSAPRPRVDHVTIVK